MELQGGRQEGGNGGGRVLGMKWLSNPTDGQLAVFFLKQIPIEENSAWVWTIIKECYEFNSDFEGERVIIDLLRKYL